MRFALFITPPAGQGQSIVVASGLKFSAPPPAVRNVGPLTHPTYAEAISILTARRPNSRRGGKILHGHSATMGGYAEPVRDLVLHKWELFDIWVWCGIIWICMTLLLHWSAGIGINFSLAAGPLSVCASRLCCTLGTFIGMEHKSWLPLTGELSRYEAPRHHPNLNKAICQRD